MEACRGLGAKTLKQVCGGDVLCEHCGRETLMSSIKQTVETVSMVTMRFWDIYIYICVSVCVYTVLLESL